MERFAERLKKLREELRYSKVQFSKLIGVTPLSLSNYESGKRFPDVRVLEKIVEKSKVNLNWLISGTGTMYNSIPSNDPRKVEMFQLYDQFEFIRFALLSTMEELKMKYPGKLGVLKQHNETFKDIDPPIKNKEVNVK